MESFTVIDVNWKGQVLRGVLAIIIGLLMASLPGLTLLAVTLLIGVFVLMLGVMAIVLFLSLEEKGRGTPLLLEGILGITFGGVTFIWPNITTLLLILLLGVWCLIEGLVQLSAGLTMARNAAVRAIVMVSGALSVMIGLIFIAAPGEGALALIWLIGLFAIAFGVLGVIYGLMVRSMYRAEGMS